MYDHDCADIIDYYEHFFIRFSMHACRVRCAVAYATVRVMCRMIYGDVYTYLARAGGPLDLVQRALMRP